MKKSTKATLRLSDNDNSIIELVVKVRENKEISLIDPLTIENERISQEFPLE